MNLSTPYKYLSISKMISWQMHESRDERKRLHVASCKSTNYAFLISKTWSKLKTHTARINTINCFVQMIILPLKVSKSVEEKVKNDCELEHFCRILTYVELWRICLLFSLTCLHFHPDTRIILCTQISTGIYFEN